MTFFYDLNKKLDAIREKPELTHQKLNERDMSRAAKGYEKYGKEGMEALAKAGRDNKSLDPIRAKYNKYDNEVDESMMADEGNAFSGAVAKAKADGIQPGEKVQVGGKEYPVKEAAKYRDPKYKDKLYTQEPPDYTYGPDMDDAYYNPKPDDYEGRKRKIGGGEFDHNDPLRRGDGIGRSGIKNNILDRGPRKGLPSRDQITSLKGSIKSARGTHAEPNLPEAGAPMTPKQKSFAKLAPPADKITFADKIAGAKQEVDEMLGDVAAEAMKGAIGKMGANSRQAQTTMKHVNASNASPKVKAAIGKASADIEPGAQGYRSRAAALKAAGIKGAPGEVDEEDDNNPFTSWKKPRADRPKVGDVEHGSKHDIKHTATGRSVTRRTDPNTGHSVGADDDTPAAGDKRGKGRPKGTGKSIGAKGPSGNSKLMKREDEHDVEDQGEYDQEGDMAKDDIKTIVRHAQALSQVLGDNDNLPEWVQSKLSKIEGMMISIDEYMQNQAGDDEEEPIAEKAVSKKQQKFMGMVHAAQKGEKPASKEVGNVAKTMKKSDAEDFASTKHKGLPEKKAKKEVDETTVSGSVASSEESASDSGAPKAKKSSGSMVYGKGVYENAVRESFNAKLNTVLNEGMSISANQNEDGTKSLTVTATDEDADQLAQILAMAGLGGGHMSGEQPCSTCGQSPCGCDTVAEDLANSPNAQYSNTDTMVNTLSGGLNGRKNTGQTVVAPYNRQPSRQGPMAESNEKRLWELYNRYETK